MMRRVAVLRAAFTLSPFSLLLTEEEDDDNEEETKNRRDDEHVRGL